MRKVRGSKRDSNVLYLDVSGFGNMNLRTNFVYLAMLAFPEGRPLNIRTPACPVYQNACLFFFCRVWL